MPAPPSHRRRRHWIERIVFYSLVVFVAIPMAFCRVLTHVPRMEPTGPPVGFEQIWPTSADGVRLRLWFRQVSPDRPAVLIVHGLGDTMESYVDVASVFARRGHSVALIDLRAHGGSSGRQTTMGGLESEDVRAALGWLAAGHHAPHGTILSGYSAGAVACLRAAVGRADVRAVIVEAPFDSYRHTVTRHAWLFYRIPSWFPLIPITVRFAGWSAGFDPDDVDAVAAAGALRVPLLAVVDGSDPRMPEAVVRRVFDAHPGPKSLWVAPGVPHVGAVLRHDYWPTISRFLCAHDLESGTCSPD